MSDNDLIKCGEVRKLATPLETEDGEILVVDMDDVDEIPAVPREMTAKEYLETEARMCKHYGLPCSFDLSGFTVDEAIEMVAKFAWEHPERSEDDAG